MEKAKFCVDCRYCKMDGGVRCCTAPVPELYNLVTGEMIKALCCEEARRISIFCGKGGEWFELKIQPISIPQTEAPPTGKVQVIAGRGDREVKR